MNILERLRNILDMQSVFLDVLPEQPNEALVLAVYSSEVQRFFDTSTPVYRVQVRSRAPTAERAYARAQEAMDKLDRHHDEHIAVLATSSVMGIGQDDKGRRECTVNFSVTMKE